MGLILRHHGPRGEPQVDDALRRSSAGLPAVDDRRDLSAAELLYKLELLLVAHYTSRVTWEVEFTDQFGEWWKSLSEREQDTVRAAVEIVQERGPALGRPFVDTVHGSRHANMKELRSRAGHIRVLFAFDPRRTAILLIGGDKTDRWNEWYRDMIPVADDLYDEHLREIQEGA